jgi:hypothetical protein
VVQMRKAADLMTTFDVCGRARHLQRELWGPLEVAAMLLARFVLKLVPHMAQIRASFPRKNG